MSGDRTSILFACSPEFKEEVGKFAAKNNTDVSKVIREAVANVIGYDIRADDVKLGRKKTYTSKQLLYAYQHSEHIRNVAALQESLERKGVKVDD